MNRYNSFRPGQVWLDTGNILKRPVNQLMCGSPIEWQGEKPVIKWHDEWRIEDYK